MDATFTTLLTHTALNDYGNEVTTSLIHKTAGLVPAGSGTRNEAEGYIVRVTRKGDACFYGSRYNSSQRFEALEDYNKRIGTYVKTSEA